MRAEKIENILVRGVNWVGDAVMTMPAIRSVRRAFPSARISLLVKPWVAAVHEGDPHIDEIIIYEDEHRGVSGKVRLAGLLRAKKFDMAILLQNAFDAAASAFLAGIPRRIGYARDLRGFLLTDPVKYDSDDRKMHHIDYYLELLRKAGIKAEYSLPWIYLRLEERLAARKTLANLKRPILGINPGAAFGSSKRWPPERFAQVAERFVREKGGSAVIFGGPKEAGIAGEIASLIKTRVLNLAGKTSLRELCGLISECDVFISNDSGPMHIGYAVRTPMAAIFGSTEPAFTGPAGDGGEVVRKKLECSPCFKRECPLGTLRCMEEIGADEVYEAVLRLLPKNRAVFLDRDGTICRDAHFLNSWEDLEIFPDIAELQRLKSSGFKLIGISNQSGIARGFVEEEFARAVNEKFVREHGFDGFYYCPHGPDEGCDCRKPEPGMLFDARAEHAIDLRRSFIVGDRDADMLLGRAVGAKTVLVMTGKQQEAGEADYTADGLKEAVKFILENK